VTKELPFIVVESMVVSVFGPTGSKFLQPHVGSILTIPKLTIGREKRKVWMYSSIVNFYCCRKNDKLLKKNKKGLKTNRTAVIRAV
jgi:hypothetical protein